MKAILAINNNEIIGDSKQPFGLPWHNPEDMSLYKEKTQGTVSLCGYKTSELMPDVQHMKLVVDLREFKLPSEILVNIDWVIGGRKTIEKYWDSVDEFHLHKLDNYEDGDCEWPELVSRLHADFKLIEIIKGDTVDQYIYRRDNETL